MKKTFNKIKTWLATLWVAIVSFIWNVMAEIGDRSQFEQTAGVAPYDDTVTNSYTLKNLIKRVFVFIPLIVWVIKFIKMRKIEDKPLRRKKRWKVAIITLVIMIAVFFLITTVYWLLNKIK